VALFPIATEADGARPRSSQNVPEAPVWPRSAPLNVAGLNILLPSRIQRADIRRSNARKFPKDLWTKLCRSGISTQGRKDMRNVRNNREVESDIKSR